MDPRLAGEAERAPNGWPGHKIIAPREYILAKRPTFIIEQASTHAKPLEEAEVAGAYAGYVQASFWAPSVGRFVVCLIRREEFDNRAKPSRRGGFELLPPEAGASS